MIPKRAPFKTLMLKTYLKIDKKVIKLKTCRYKYRLALIYNPTVTKPY